MANGTEKALFKGTQVVWFVLMLVEVILALRFALKLMGANAAAGFTSFVYGLSSLFTAPFQAVFRNSRVESSVFEWTTLLAMGVYYLLALVIVRFFLVGKPVTEAEASAKLDAQDPTSLR